MKIYTAYGIAGLKGKKGDQVYYSLPNCNFVIQRERPASVKEAQQHRDFRAISRQLKDLNPSGDYRNDFRVYTALYKQLSVARVSIANWYNLYINMMWEMHKAGVIDLLTITREIIYDQSLPCISVKAAVEAGFLPEVTNWQALDKVI